MSTTGSLRFSPRRLAGILFVGVFLTQLAWILALPTYRGLDEFDHVYKAEAVARGQWISTQDAPDGRGALVTINEQTIRDATRVCESYSYTGPDNCRPIEVLGDGRATAATAAASYNPAYYLVAGTLARPFAGDAAVYAMRIITAVLCAGLIAWAVALLALWARTAWPLLAFLTCLTPVLVYSTTVAAPNGLTYAGAVLTWMSLLALDRGVHRPAVTAGAFFVGATSLLVTHTTGAMWLALIAVSLVPLQGIRGWVLLMRSGKRPWALALCGVGLVTLLCVWWVLAADANQLGRTRFLEGYTATELLQQFALWVIQSVGAFPMRDELAPTLVYAVWLPLFLAVLFVILRLGAGREKLAGGVMIVLFFLVPAVLTHVAFASEGFAWQGRYSLPLAVGFSALAARVADRRTQDIGPAWTLGLLVLTATAMTASTLSVALNEMTEGLHDPLAAAIPEGFVLVGVLTVLGVAAPVLALRHDPNGLRRLAHSVNTGP